MGERSLRTRLEHATLILGNVSDTVDTFVRDCADPIAFI